MYFAPLNYDRYFKKVFQETKITIRFLDFFFDVEIFQTITGLTHDQIDELRRGYSFNI